jgi:hypothetical protein
VLRAGRRRPGPSGRRAVHAVAARAGTSPGRCGARLVPAGDGRQDAPPHFSSNAEPDGDFDGAAPDPELVAEAWDVWRAEVAFAERFVAEAPDLDVTGNDRWHGAVSLRWVLVHMVEEYARHLGHVDLLRQRIDGAVGQ